MTDPKALDVFYKHPDEAYTVGVSFIDKLPTGANLASADISEVIDLLDGSNKSLVVVGTVDVSGTILEIPVQGGTDGHDYLISINATLDNDNVLNERVLMKVRAR
jgi:hypothetical protein